MNIENALLKMARALVQQVLAGIAAEKNKLQSQVKEQLDSFMKAMVSEVWVSPDADTFKNDLSKLIAGVDDILGIVQRVDSGVQNGMACIDKADNTAMAKIQALNNTFSKI